MQAIILQITCLMQAIVLTLSYQGFKTFNVKLMQNVAWVTFDYAPVNVLGKPMLDDLNRLAGILEKDRHVKVAVFQSSNPDIFVCHEDFDMLSRLPAAERSMQKPILYSQQVMNRIASLPQATVAKIEGMARSAGLELALACDMRFAARGRAVFEFFNVGFGMVPTFGGTHRLQQVAGVGRALELVLGAHDFDADLAERYGVINRAMNPDDIGPFVEELANRIGKFPSAGITACKRSVKENVANGQSDVQGAKIESYQLGQAMSQTPAARRLAFMKTQGIQYDLETQKNWDKGIMDIQSID